MTLFRIKNSKLCMCFGHSFTQQQHFGGLKNKTFENSYSGPCCSRKFVCCCLN